jgi:hypothetical protein
LGLSIFTGCVGAVAEDEQTQNRMKIAARVRVCVCWREWLRTHGGASADDRRQLIARVRTHPLARAVDVAFDTAHRHHQALGDRTVGKTGDNQFDDFALTARNAMLASKSLGS